MKYKFVQIFILLFVSAINFLSLNYAQSQDYQHYCKNPSSLGRAGYVCKVSSGINTTIETEVNNLPSKMPSYDAAKKTCVKFCINKCRRDAPNLQEEKKCSIFTCEETCSDSVLGTIIENQKKPFMNLYNKYLDECSRSLFNSSDCEKKESLKYCALAEKRLTQKRTERNTDNVKAKSLKDSVEEFKQDIKTIKRQYLRRLKDLAAEKASFAATLDIMKNDCDKSDFCELPTELTPPLLIEQEVRPILNSKTLYDGVLESFQCKNNKPTPTATNTPAPTEEIVLYSRDKHGVLSGNPFYTYCGTIYNGYSYGNGYMTTNNYCCTLEYFKPHAICRTNKVS